MAADVADLHEVPKAPVKPHGISFTFAGGNVLSAVDKSGPVVVGINSGRRRQLQHQAAAAGVQIFGIQEARSQGPKVTTCQHYIRIPSTLHDDLVLQTTRQGVIICIIL